MTATALARATAACTPAASACGFTWLAGFLAPSPPHPLTPPYRPLLPRYLFDYTNATENGLADFIINEVVLGANGLGNANLSGFYLDE